MKKYFFCVIITLLEVYMPGLRKEIINFAEKQPRSVKEIADQFDIPRSKQATLRNRLKELNIKTKDTRGRRKVEL